MQVTKTLQPVLLGAFKRVFYAYFVMIFQGRRRLFSGEGVRFKSIKKACHDHATDFQTNTLCF